VIEAVVLVKVLESLGEREPAHKQIKAALGMAMLVEHSIHPARTITPEVVAVLAQLVRMVLVPRLVMAVLDKHLP